MNRWPAVAYRDGSVLTPLSHLVYKLPGRPVALRLRIQLDVITVASEGEESDKENIRDIHLLLLEKLTGLQLVKKFPAFHGTRRFITALTSVRHLSLSWANPVQFIYPYPTSWRSILILSTHLRLGLPSGSFPPVSPPRPYTLPILTHTCHMLSPSHSRFSCHPYTFTYLK